MKLFILRKQPKNDAMKPLKLLTKLLMIGVVVFFSKGKINAQTFSFPVNESESPTLTGLEFKNYISTNTFQDAWSTYPLSNTVPCSWTGFTNAEKDRSEAGIDIPAVSTDYSFKELRAFIELKIDHAQSTVKKYDPYVYMFQVKVKAYRSPTNCTLYDEFTEYLMLSYVGDGTYAYQDIATKSYYGYYSIQAQIVNVFDITNHYLSITDPNNATSQVLNVKNAEGNYYLPTNTNCQATIIPPAPNSAVTTYTNGYRDALFPCQIADNWTFKTGVYYQKFVTKVSGGSPATVYSNNMAGITLSPTHVAPNFLINNELKVKWDPNINMQTNGAVPAMYELEWTYVDNYKVEIDNGSVTVSDKSQGQLEYNFEENSTRIITNKTEYNIPLIYKRGYIVYRVRMLRPDNSQYKNTLYSDWSLSPTGILAGVQSMFKIITPHESDDKNWNYQVSFAEDGKSKNVVSYFDGLLKNRQSATKFGSLQNQLIVTESIYNHEGAVALQTLPIPIINPSTGGLNLSLKYQPNFIDPASINTSILDNAGSLGASPSLTSSSTASQYYSTDNPLLASAYLSTPEGRIAKAIPDAEGYPYIRTRYAKDDPSRVYMQSGAGEALKLGLGHETTYRVMEPTQDELDLYQGLNAGIKSFYDKTVTKDPNGQLSFAINNREGKPVMTGLMSPPTTNSNPNTPIVNLDAIDPSMNVNSTSNLLNGLSKNWDDTKLNYDINYISEVASNTFKYGYSLASFSTGCTSSNAGFSPTISAPAMEADISVSPESYPLNNSISLFSGTNTTNSLGPTTTPLNNNNLIGENTARYHLAYNKNDVVDKVTTFLAPFRHTTMTGPVISCLTPYYNDLKNEIDNISDQCAYDDNDDYNECGEYENIMKMHMQPGNEYAKYMKLGTNSIVAGNEMSYLRIVGWKFNNTNYIAYPNPAAEILTLSASFPVAANESIAFQIGNLPDFGHATFGLNSQTVNQLNQLKTNAENVLNMPTPDFEVWTEKWGLLLDAMSSYFEPVYFYQTSPLIANTSTNISALQTQVLYANLRAKDLIDNYESCEPEIVKLHPEHCLLDQIYCDDKQGIAFVDKLSAIEDFTMAQNLGLSTFTSITNADPEIASPKVLVHFGTPNIFKDAMIVWVYYSNTNVAHAVMRIDQYAYFQTLMQLNPNSIYYTDAEYDAIVDLYNSVNGGLNPTYSTIELYVSSASQKFKDKYFENLRSLYLVKRREIMFRAVTQNSQPCSIDYLSSINQDKRVFKPYNLFATGGAELAPPGTNEAANNSSIIAANNQLFQDYTINSLPVPAITIPEQYKVQAKSYSLYIFEKLKNCALASSSGTLAIDAPPASSTSYLFPSAYYGGASPSNQNLLETVKRDIEAFMIMNFLSSNSKVRKYGLTPIVVQNILKSRGIETSDLCNPWLIEYEKSPEALLKEGPCDMKNVWRSLNTNSAFHHLPSIFNFDLISLVKSQGVTTTTITDNINLLTKETTNPIVSNEFDELIYKSLGLNGATDPTASTLSPVPIKMRFDYTQDCTIIPNMNNSLPPGNFNFATATPCSSSSNNLLGLRPLQMKFTLEGFNQGAPFNSYNGKKVIFEFTRANDNSLDGFYHGCYQQNVSCNAQLCSGALNSCILQLSSYLTTNTNLPSELIQEISTYHATQTKGRLYFLQCDNDPLDDSKVNLKVLYAQIEHHMTSPQGVSEFSFDAYFHVFNLSITGLDLDKPEFECVTPVEMKREYNNFKTDVIQKYNVKGEGHPYYNDVLENYFNYQFRKDYDAQKYKDFITGCNLADFNDLDAYLGYFQAKGSKASMDALITYIKDYSVITNGSSTNPNTVNLENVQYTRIKPDAAIDEEYVYVDFNSIFKDEKLGPFIIDLKEFLTLGAVNYNQSGTSTNPALTGLKYGFNLLQKDVSLYTSLPNEWSVLVNELPGSTPAIQGVTPSVTDVELITSNASNQNFSQVYKKITYNFGSLTSTNLINKAIYDADNAYFINSSSAAYIFDKPFVPLKTHLTTLNVINESDEKKAYLHRLYNEGAGTWINATGGYHPFKHSSIIDFIKVNPLYSSTSASRIYDGNYHWNSNPSPIPLYAQSTYMNFSRKLFSSTTNDNDYVSGTLMLSNAATNVYGQDFLLGIFNAMKLSTTGYTSAGTANCPASPSTIFYASGVYNPTSTLLPQSLNYSSGSNTYNGNYKIWPRRLDERTIWFKVKENPLPNSPSRQFNIYIRIPDFLTLTDLSAYNLTSIEKLYSIEGGTKACKLKFTKATSCAGYNELYLYARTDFVLDNREPIILDNIMVCDGEDDAEPFNPCFENLIAEAEAQAKRKFESDFNLLKQRLITEFENHIKQNLQCTFKLTMPKMKYAMTIYGYDRAGNLAYTVPPMGVRSIEQNPNASSVPLDDYISNIDTKRNQSSYGSSIGPLTINVSSSTLSSVANHEKVSKYTYNSLNQLVTQSTPDAGETKFFYDPTGKLVFSQNAKQSSKKVPSFSYTLYDKQNRIIETGEIDVNLFTIASNDVNLLIQNLKTYNFTAPLLEDANEYIKNKVRMLPRRDVVRTFYDQPVYNFVTLDNNMSAQENLRSRVATIANYPFLGGVGPSNTINPMNGITVAIHYSYDLSGNVKTLTYDMPQLQYLNQRYKRIDYDYDLYSGKVNLVSYNRGFTDQFYQQYKYDDDNRLTEVKTSQDGILWDDDAKYSYYPHGPLARIQLGDLQVQGVDFAYTLQGWLKSINGDKRDPQKDMGADGFGNSNVQADVLNHSIYYFENDYTPINGTDATNSALSKRNFVETIPADRSLYNGNISATFTEPGKFEPLFTEYWYDQLNRIKKASYKFPDYSIWNSSSFNYANALKPLSSFANGGVLNTSTSTIPLSDVDKIYQSEYWYDFDGNLTHLKRYAGNLPNVNNGEGFKDNINGKTYLMDDINYKYDLINNPSGVAAIRNRLSNYLESEDHTAATTFNDDLQFNSSTPERFTYDEIGNLIQDKSNPTLLNKIVWNLYGKVAGIEYSTGELSKFMYEPGGNRFMKSFVKPNNSYTPTGLTKLNEYYIREASGNILAIYKQQQDFKFEKPYMELNDKIKNNVYYPSIMSEVLGSNDEFANLLSDYAVNRDESLATAILANKTASYYIPKNRRIKSAMILNTGSIVDDLAANNPSVIQNSIGGFSLDVINPAISESNLSLKEQFAGMLYDFSSGGISSANDLLKMFNENYEISDQNEFAIKMIEVLMESSPESLSVNLGEFYQTHPAIWQGVLQQMLNSTDYKHNDYSETYSYGSFANFVQQMLADNGDDTEIVTYFEGLSAEDVTNTFDKVTEPKERIMTVFMSEPENVFASIQASSQSNETMNSVLSDMTTLNFSQLVSDLLVNSNAEVDVHNMLVEVLNEEKYYLAEHHMYGSSRLGIKNYWPNHYSFEYNKSADNSMSWEDKLASNELLSMHKPWYSQAYNSLINANQTAPWGQQNTDRVLSTRMLGLKQYELTNHLGNVMAVVTDKVREQEVQGSSYKTPGYANLTGGAAAATLFPTLSASYDYYPFGMLMPHRFNQDNTLQCAPVTQPIFQTIWVNILDLDMLAPSQQNAFGITNSGTLTVGENGMTITTTPSQPAEASTMVSGIQANKEVNIKLTATNNGSEPLLVQLKQQDDHGEWQVIASTTVAYTTEVDMKGTAINNNAAKLSFVVFNGSANVKYIKGYRHDVLTGTRTISICNSDGILKDDYRFGFNGQEKDNEVKGVGNSLNYKYRMEDTRLGRFFAVDPLAKEYPELTTYQVASNNPVWMNELEGLEGVPVSSDPYAYMVEGFRTYFDAGVNLLDFEFIHDFFTEDEVVPSTTLGNTTTKSVKTTTNTTTVGYYGWELFQPNAYQKNSDGTYSKIPSPKVKVQNSTNVESNNIATTQSSPNSSVRKVNSINNKGEKTTTTSAEYKATSNSGVQVKGEISLTTNSNGISTKSGKISVGAEAANIFVEVQKSNSKTNLSVGVQSKIQTPPIYGTSYGSQTTIKATYKR